MNKRAAHLFKAVYERLTAKIYRCVGIDITRWPFRIPPQSDTQSFFLTALRVYFCDPHPHDKVLYLTMDAELARAEENISAILDVLRQKQVHAAFFLLGKIADNIPAELLMRMGDEGHLVLNHTMSHPNLTQCSARAILDELDACRAVYMKRTGKPMPPYMRCPGGRLDLPTALKLYRAGYTAFQWQLHVIDWREDQEPDPEKFLEYYSKNARSGAVILQHTFSMTTVAMLGPLIDKLREQGFRFGELTEFAPL